MSQKSNSTVTKPVLEKQSTSLRSSSLRSSSLRGGNIPKINSNELTQTQGIISLTAIGVGAVISGDFYGWNFGLDKGGFGGLIIGTILVCIMYIGVALSLAEMSSMYPSSEGAYIFSKEAFGGYLGYLCGLFATIEYVLLVPVVLTALGDHLNTLFGITNPDIQIVWWATTCLFYGILQLWGPKPTFLSNTIFTAISLITLFLYWCICISLFIDDSTETIHNRLYNIPIDPEYSDSSYFFPKGIYGVFTSLTFAAWFFIAFEELPLTGEDAINPQLNIPYALVFSIIILTICAFLTLTFSCMIPGGSYNISNAATPLITSLNSGIMNECVNYNIEGDDVCNSVHNCSWNYDEYMCKDIKLSNTALAWDTLINLGTLIALIASCHAIIYAAGRQLFSMTRNGCFHPVLRFDKISGNTPRIALTVVILIAFIITVMTYKAFNAGALSFLLNLSVAAACISYIFSMCAFIKLRFLRKNKHRPYKSKFGIFGAAYAAFFSFCILLSFFVDVERSQGTNSLIAVFTAFFGVYLLSSLEYLVSCGGRRKSGAMRNEEYDKQKQMKENAFSPATELIGGQSASRETDLSPLTIVPE